MLDRCGVPVPEGYRGGDWCEAGFTLLLAEAAAEKDLSDRIMMESLGPKGPSKTLEEYRKIFKDKIPDDVKEDELDDVPIWLSLVRCWNKWADYQKKQVGTGQEDPAAAEAEAEAAAAAATPAAKKKKLIKKKKSTMRVPAAGAGAAVGAASAPSAGLLDLDGVMIRIVCAFLDPVEWMNLRETCPSCRASAGETPPAPAPFPYKVVLWSLDNGEHQSLEVWHGAAKSLSAAWDGAREVIKQSGIGDYTSTKFSFRWVDFDMGADGERRVPISTFDTMFSCDDFGHDEVSRVTEWSTKFLGVKEVGRNLKRAVSGYSFYGDSYHFSSVRFNDLYLRCDGGGHDNVEEVASQEIIPNKSLLALLLWDKSMDQGEAKVEKFGCHRSGCVLCGSSQDDCRCSMEVRYKLNMSEGEPKDVWYNPNPDWVDKPRNSTTEFRCEMLLGPEGAPSGEAQWLVFDTNSAYYYD